MNAKTTIRAEALFEAVFADRIYRKTASLLSIVVFDNEAIKNQKPPVSFYPIFLLTQKRSNFGTFAEKYKKDY